VWPARKRYLKYLYRVMKKIGLSWLVLFIVALAQAQTSFIDSLEQQLPRANPAERLRLLSDLTWECASHDVSKSILFANQLLVEAEKTRDSTAVAEANNGAAVAYYRKGDYAKALALNTRAYRIRKASGNLQTIGSSLNKFVNIFTDQVQLDSAMHYGLEAVRIYEKLADTSSLALSLNSVANVYHKDRDFLACKEMAMRAYALSRSISFVYGWAGAAGNIAAASQELKRYDEALEWYAQAQIGFETIDSPNDLATVASNRGFIYSQQGKLTEAEAYYTEAIVLAQQIGETMGEAMYTANLASVLLRRKNFKEAQLSFEKALVTAEKEQLERIRLQCYDGLAMVHAYMGNGEEASTYLEKYKQLRDEVYTSDRSAQLAEMRTIYDTEKKEEENRALIRDNEQKDQQRKRIIASAIAALVGVVIILVFVYQSRKNKAEALYQAQLVKERERGLAAVFEGIEEERKRIAKDLHDGIGQQMSGLRMNWEALKERVKETLPEEGPRMDKLTAVLDDSAKELRSLSHQMMPRAIEENGLLPALEEMLEKSLGLGPIRYRLEHFQVEGKRFHAKIEVGLYRIAQELVNNVVKHSHATELSVQLYKSKEFLILIVEDNGKGFVRNAREEGIGLTNITSRLNTVNGDVQWEPGPSSGTVATIRVPVNLA
jgi:two-component system, NarL family, sensor kinase